MPNNYKENQAGFTLIEVLIAITIFAIGILGVAAMQTMATGGNSVAMTTTNLTTLAAQQMEELMALPFDQVVDTNQTTPNDTGELGLNNTGADPAVAGGADYWVQRGDIVLAANVAPGVPIPIVAGGGATTIRVIASKLNANLDKVIRTVTLTSINSAP